MGFGGALVERRHCGDVAEVVLCKRRNSTRRRERRPDQTESSYTLRRRSRASGKEKQRNKAEYTQFSRKEVREPPKANKIWTVGIGR